jgi:hypothetical protein
LEIDAEWQEPSADLLLAFKQFVGTLAAALAPLGAVVVLDTNAMWTSQIGQVMLLLFALL